MQNPSISSHICARQGSSCDEADSAEVISIAFAGNSALLNALPKLSPSIKGKGADVIQLWNSILQGVPHIRHITVEQLMKQFDKAEGVDVQWRDYIRKRYQV